MDKKLKMAVALLQIVGGLVGLGIIGRAFLSGDVPLITMVIHLGFVFIFAYGIIAGLVLIKMERLGMILSMIFQAIQIPIIMGPSLSYSMFSGACFNIYKHAMGWGFNFNFGSSYVFHVNSGEPGLMGINIVAVVLLILLIKEFRLLLMYSRHLGPQAHMVHSAGRPAYRNDAELYGSPVRLPKQEQS